MLLKKAIDFYDVQSAELSGENVKKFTRKLKDMTGFYKDEKAFRKKDLETPVYEVQTHNKTNEEGGLSFGTSYIFPGKVGNEYFMTKGHFHSIRNRAEYYWGVKGEGALILMNESGNSKVVSVSSGTLHYIPGNIAHRLVNTGEETLVVGACWPSDAGHDYGTIKEKGFSVSIEEENGNVVLIE